MELIKVALRSRPLLKDEKNGHESCLEFPSDARNRVIVGYEKDFKFDYAFDDSTSQQTIYDVCGSRYVQNFLDGSNTTIFAYGQTGSGKTFTMGTNYNHSEQSEDAGIIPRAVDDIFAAIVDGFSTSYNLTISFFEIYKEEIFDLLSETRSKVKLHDQGNAIVVEFNFSFCKILPSFGVTLDIVLVFGQTIIKLTNIRECNVTTAEEALDCLKKGGTNRTTGRTALNNNSSRSHIIFTLKLKQTFSSGECKSSSFHLVDLAGSEMVKKTKSKGERFREGVNINLGLMNLTRVITALNNKSQKAFIPYRNSALTQVLKESLTGSGKTLMIACVSPSSEFLSETVNTMRYAIQASQIPSQSLKISGKENNPFRKQLDMILPTPANRRDRFNSMPTPTMHSTPFDKCLNSTINNVTPAINDTLLMPPPQPVFDFVSPVKKCCGKDDLTSLLSPLTKRVDGIVKSQVNETLASFGNELLAKLKRRMSTHPSVDISPFSGVKVSRYSENARTKDGTFFPSPFSCRTNLSPRKESAADISHVSEKHGYEEEASKSESPLRLSSSDSEETITVSHHSSRSPSMLLIKHRARVLKVLNTGSMKHLQCLPIIGQKRAKIIHTWRTVYGPFESFDELKSVKGLPKTFVRRFSEANLLI